MIILHLHWRDRQFFVWGEQPMPAYTAASSSRAAKAVAHPPSHASETPHVPASPFDPGPGTLAELGQTILKGLLDGELTTLRLELPTVQVAASRRFPLPSQSFLLPESLRGSVASAPARLETWSVTALRLPWRKWVTLLGSVEERKLKEGLFLAEEVFALAELFRYAGALVARGRFLPTLRTRQEAGSTVWEAVWSPCVDGEEDARIQAFAERLPPVAYRTQNVAEPLAAVETLLTEWVDRIVRVSVSTTLSMVHAARGCCYSAHDAWFTALRGESRTIRWQETKELERLAEQVQAWRRPVEGMRDGASRPVFTLHFPEKGDARWLLEMGLKDAGAVPSRRSKSQPLGEATLLALGQAAMLFPPLGQAEVMADGRHAAALNTFEAYHFLTAGQALLRSAGYAVILPPEWKPETAAGFALDVDVSPHTGDSYLPDARVQIRHTVTFRGEAVSQEELKQVLDADVPLVFFRGSWMLVDPKQIQQALRLGRQEKGEEAPAVQAMQLALGSQAWRHGLPVAGVRGHGWVDTLFSRLSGDENRFSVLEPPSGFCGELRPYQLRGYSWLVYLRSCGFGGCLADDMGLGKTIQALAFLLHEKERGERRPVLVVGPMSVLGNWMREAQRFAPSLRCHLHHGGTRWHGDSFAQEMLRYDLVITSYHLLYRDYADLRQVDWSGILLDEAQNIKNPETRQSQVARALRADYRIALTGTPMENHVGDLWSIMDFLNPDMLGKRTTFRETFHRPIQTGSDPGARIRLRRMTAPFILRRLKTDKHIISDLPEKIEAKVYCPLTREQVRLYQDELSSFHRELEQAEGIGRRGLILATLTRLKQICNHPEHYLGKDESRQTEAWALTDARASGRKARRPEADFAHASGKLMRLTEELEEVFANDECALVFTQYAEMGHLLSRYLCETFGRDMPYLHGGVPRAAREQMVSAFQETRSPQAFVLSLKAGGLGLNLTRATHVFHYDRWWNPAVENQATDRAFRIGQTKRVLVHKFICNGTLEDRIDALIESKSALATEIIGHGEQALTELSDELLRSLLTFEAPESD